MFRIFLIVLVISYQNSYSQQTIKISLLDSKTSEPIPYASIKVLNTIYGTYSDEKGFFELIDVKNDTVILTCVGYKSKKIIIADIVANSVYLDESVKELPNITVGKRQLIDDTIVGITSLKNDMTWGASGKGEEFAQKIDLQLKEGEFCKIKKLYLMVKNFDSEEPVLLHIYSVDQLNHRPDKELLQKQYLVSKKNFHGKMIIADLQAENIFIYDKVIFVGFEWLPTANGKTPNILKPTLLPMTHQLSDTLTYSRTIIHPQYHWFPFLLTSLDSKIGKPVNTMFSLEIERYK